MSRQSASRSSNAAKTGASIGALAYAGTGIIPMPGYMHVLDWMHKSVMSALHVTSNNIPFSPENITGMAIYLLGFVIFATFGAAIGALVGSRAGAEPPAEPANSTNQQAVGNEVETTAVLSTESTVVADTTAPGPSVETWGKVGGAIGFAVVVLLFGFGKGSMKESFLTGAAGGGIGALIFSLLAIGIGWIKRPKA